MTAAPLSLAQQADLISHLVGRAKMRDGADAGSAWMLIEKKDMDDLRFIADRLRRMAPHETKIKQIVMAK